MKVPKLATIIAQSWRIKAENSSCGCLGWCMYKHARWKESKGISHRFSVVGKMFADREWFGVGQMLHGLCMIVAGGEELGWKI